MTQEQQEEESRILGVRMKEKANLADFLVEQGTFRCNISSFKISVLWGVVVAKTWGL